VQVAVDQAVAAVIDQHDVLAVVDVPFLALIDAVAGRIQLPLDAAVVTS